MFLCSLLSLTPTTIDSVASFVNAINLHLKCPPSLLKGLTNSHPDREIWLNSFFEEKQGIESLGTSGKIRLGEYCALHKKDAPKATPTICVLSIKHYKNLLPLCAKFCIVVLGNHKNQVWSKSNHYAPVLWSNSLWFLVTMAVSKCCPLPQGDCKKAFCQGILPNNKITIVRSPSSNPEAQPNEYWLLLCTLYDIFCSPHHQNDKITKIIVSIGLTLSLKDLCHFTGFVCNPHQPTTPSSEHPLSLELYVDDFVYFSKDPTVEALFCCLLMNVAKLISWVFPE
jgi:hypothetical protein